MISAERNLSVPLLPQFEETKEQIEELQRKYRVKSYELLETDEDDTVVTQPVYAVTIRSTG